MGGGDEPVVNAAPLSATNYGEKADVAVLGVVGSVSLNENFGSLSAGETENPSSASYRALGSGKVDAMARFALERASSGPTTQLKAASAQTTSCLGGGSLSSRFNDADYNGVASSGDSLTVDANHCVLETGQPPINGRLMVTYDSITFGANASLVSASLTMTFTQFSSAGVVLNGAASVSANATSATLTYRNLSSSYEGQTLVYDFFVTQQVSAVPNTLVVQGSIVINGSAYALSTPVIIQLGAVYPSAGTLRIADGQGNRVDVVMHSDRFVSNLYLAGDGVVDASTTTLWANL